MKDMPGRSRTATRIYPRIVRRLLLGFDPPLKGFAHSKPASFWRPVISRKVSRRRKDPSIPPFAKLRNHFGVLGRIVLSLQPMLMQEVLNALGGDNVILERGFVSLEFFTTFSVPFDRFISTIAAYFGVCENAKIVLPI
jgi:hypothetical protein